MPSLSHMLRAQIFSLAKRCSLVFKSSIITFFIKSEIYLSLHSQELMLIEVDEDNM
jgi:hypothetical protein